MRFCYKNLTTRIWSKYKMSPSEVHRWLEWQLSAKSTWWSCRDRSSSPSTHTMANNYLKLQFQDLSWPPKALGIYRVHRRTCRQNTKRHKVTFKKCRATAKSSANISRLSALPLPSNSLELLRNIDKRFLLLLSPRFNTMKMFPSLWLTTQLEIKKPTTVLVYKENEWMLLPIDQIKKVLSALFQKDDASERAFCFLSWDTVLRGSG